MEESWKPVVGFVGEYEVSDHGRVRTLKWKKTPYVMNQTISSRGYYRVDLSRNDKKKYYNVHQLVACAFIGVQESGIHVCHGDGNKLNNNLSNLRYGTPFENIQDSRRHGGFIGQGFSPLTDEDVVAIFNSTDRPMVIARRYNIHHTHVSKIKQRKNRKHITAPLKERSLEVV
jgi:hypothetical protein